MLGAQLATGRFERSNLFTFAGSTFLYVKDAYRTHTKGIQNAYGLSDGANALTLERVDFDPSQQTPGVQVVRWRCMNQIKVDAL